MASKIKHPNPPHLSVQIFHYRYYRYVRMMLRRYPKMRQERLAWSVGPGINGICQNTFHSRVRAEMERQSNVS